eukprot:Amastigsp_a676328_761.p2 type:complete len:120 gc:universal Amastigsp_a676328_761:205-564(+)
MVRSSLGLPRTDNVGRRGTVRCEHIETHRLGRRVELGSLDLVLRLPCKHAAHASNVACTHDLRLCPENEERVGRVFHANIVAQHEPCGRGNPSFHLLGHRRAHNNHPLAGNVWIGGCCT